MLEEWNSTAFRCVGIIPLATVSSGMRPGAGRDRENLDVREGETDYHWLQRSAAIDRATRR